MIRILLVEDDPAKARQLSALLAEASAPGFKTVRASRLSSALKRLRSGEIDLVLLDLSLPDSQGMDTFHQVIRGAPSLPIIVLGDPDDESPACQAVKEGAQDYLFKHELDSRLLARAARYAVERKKLENEIRLREERLNLALESVNDGIYDFNLRDGTTFFSPRYYQMLGYEAQEFPGYHQTFLNLVHPDDRQRVERIMQEYLSGKRLHYIAEFRMRAKSGEYRWILSRGKIVQRDPDGKPLRWLGTHADVTERRQIEEALRESQRRLKTLVSNLPGMAYRCRNDPRWTMEFVSEGSFALLGYSPEDLIGSRVIAYGDLIHPEDRLQVFDQVQEALKNQKPFQMAYRILTPQGIEKWVWEQGSGVFTEEGELLALEGLVVDITAQQQAENALRLNEARLNSLYELSQRDFQSEEEVIHFALEEAVRMTGSEGGYLHFVHEDQVNLNLFAWSRGVIQKCTTPADRHYPLDQAGIWADAARLKRPVIHNDYPNHPERKGYPEGHFPVYRHLSVPVMNEDGSMAVIAGVGNKQTPYDEADVRQLQLYMNDLWKIVQRKRAETALKAYSDQLEEMVEERARELRQAQEQLLLQERLATLGQLAGGVGHELRNPLGVISNAVYFLKLVQPEAPETVKEYLEIISAEVCIAEKIIHNLLDFARVKPSAPQFVDLLSIADRALNRYPPPGNVAVQKENCQNLPLAYVDPQQIELVLGNLLVNACQAMPEGGQLTLEGKEENGQVCFSVRDTGCGIPPDDLPRLFEPLFTTKLHGIGLGLPTSKKLVEANGGSIQVESSPGKGSVFTLCLPTQAAQP
ncbi:MAG: PAS domain-containing protein [Anaerolineae bacterium]|nr:PAS domain-containing protein [Anaerolineae bacterium]